MLYPLRTGICEVISFCRTTVLFGDNMVDLVDEHSIVCMN